MKKRQAVTTARVNTLALLNSTLSAPEQIKLACDALEEKLHMQLAEKEKKHQQEVSEREVFFQENTHLKRTAAQAGALRAGEKIREGALHQR